MVIPVRPQSRGGKPIAMVRPGTETIANHGRAAESARPGRPHAIVRLPAATIAIHGNAANQAGKPIARSWAIVSSGVR